MRTAICGARTYRTQADFFSISRIASVAAGIATDRPPALLQLEFLSLQASIAALGSAGVAKATFLNLQQQPCRSG